jgi:hypothetical protein
MLVYIERRLNLVFLKYKLLFIYIIILFEILTSTNKMRQESLPSVPVKVSSTAGM